MNELEKISVSSEDVPLLVKGIVAKLLPKQTEWSCDHEAPISQVADFVKLDGVPYKDGKETKERWLIHMDNITKQVSEDSKNERSGEQKEIYGLFDICNWGIVGYNLGISYKIDTNLFPIFDFEFYHHDYKKRLKNLEDLPILDLIYFCQINGLADLLKSKQPNNLLDDHCKERNRRAMTKKDIEKYFANDEPVKKLALLLLKNSIGDSMEFLTPKGEILYTGKPPKAPRKVHTFEEIKKFMSKDLEDALINYCTKEKWEIATAILYRRNRVKDFFGYDVRIPEELVKHHKNFISSLEPEYIKKQLGYLLGTYTPKSLTYGLDIPSDFTKQEYALFRFIQMYIGLLRMTTLVYDTPEKRQLVKGIELPRLTFRD